MGGLHPLIDEMTPDGRSEVVEDETQGLSLVQDKGIVRDFVTRVPISDSQGWFRTSWPEDRTVSTRPLLPLPPPCRQVLWGLKCVSEG